MRAFLFICALLLCAQVCFPALAEDYRNPITIEGQYPPIERGAQDYGIGDPFVMRYNGQYYLYASTCEDRVRVYTSTNLVDWSYAGYCTEGRDVYFAYAPEVTYWRGSFYMVTSPRGSGHYILKSDSPLGPFKLITDNFGYSIDGSFFKLDDGRLILLHPDGNAIKMSYIDETTMRPELLRTPTKANLKGWTEGPGLFRRGDWYYLTLTGNHVCSTGYQVAFASRWGSAVGEYLQREDHTLLINSVFGDEFKGLGHSSNTVGPDLDSMYIAYHSLVHLTGPARLYNVDRLFTNGGLLYTTGPTNFAMPVPAMPDVYGDVAADAHDFAETEDGWFATIPATGVFTQECNYILESGEAAWILGEKDGAPVSLVTDNKCIALKVGDELVSGEMLPEMGETGRLHTLRVEHNADVLYAYVDDMRVLTMEQPGFTAERIGALKADGVRYSFLACTAKALGSGDNTAVKAIPGGFSAIHAVNAETLAYELAGEQEERAALLGSADYAVRVAETADYCFDLTVRHADAGKQLTIALDGETIWQGEIPTRNVKADMITFTTAPVALPAGDHTLTITADHVLVNRVGTFAWAAINPVDTDFSNNDQRDRFYTLGAFNSVPSKSMLKISANRAGFAMFGNEGNTDFEAYVRFNIPKDGKGLSGMLIHATDVSLYDAQVDHSYFGLSASISRLGLTIQKAKYGTVGGTNFVPISAWKEAEEAELLIRAEAGVVTISLPESDEPLAVIEEASPFTHGMFGFFSTGKALEVLEMRLSPLPGVAE